MDSENRQKSDPSLSDFYNDMNEHGNAEYRKVGPNLVGELDSMPGGEWRLMVWRAVKHPTREGYAPPDGKPENRYGWEPAGMETFEERDPGLSRLRELKAIDVTDWADENPYEGPRRSYHERMRDREQE